MILLETARLRLRQFTIEDADRLVELDSDPEVMRYITCGLPTPRETYVEVILPRWFAIYRETPLLGYWAAEARDAGLFHGWLHLRPDRFDAGEPQSRGPRGGEVLDHALAMAGAAGLRKLSQLRRPGSPSGSLRQISAVRARSVSITFSRSAP